MITRTVDMLISHGVDVAVVVGIGQAEVREALEGRDVRFVFNPFYRVTNSMASLWFAREFLDGDDIILANADVFWGEGMYSDLESDTNDVVMLGDESRVDVGDYFFRVEDGLIKGYGKELARDDRTTEYGGSARIAGHLVPEFRHRLEDLVAAERYDLWWENVLYGHIDETPVHVRDMSDFFWAEIDYIDDYQRILDYIRTGDRSFKVRTG